MTKYVISVIRTLVVEADSEGEATTMSLYATIYPDKIMGIEHLSHNLKVILNQDDFTKRVEDWPESQSDTN